MVTAIIRTNSMNVSNDYDDGRADAGQPKVGMADVGIAPAPVSLKLAGQHTPAEFAGHSLRVRLPGQVTALLFGSWEAACAS